MIAYKVVERVGDNTVISCGEIPKEIRYTYSLDRINYPALKGSKFFVFKKRKDALEFKRVRSISLVKSNLEIWRVSTTELSRADDVFTIWWYAWSVVFLERISGYWNDPWLRHTNLARSIAGTHTCPSIKFLEKVA